LTCDDTCPPRSPKTRTVKQSVPMTESGDDDTYKLVHGILMGTAWLVLAPIAIGVSLIRRVSPATCCLNQNGFWFQIHFYCQILVVTLTLIGFIIIWWSDDIGGDDDGDDTRFRFLKDYWEEQSNEYDDDDRNKDSRDDDDNNNKNDDDNDSETDLLFPAFGWTEDDVEENIHPKIGISIVVLALFQAFLGFIRPHVHPPTPTVSSSPSQPLSTTTTTTVLAPSKPPVSDIYGTEPNDTDDNNNATDDRGDMHRNENNNNNNNDHDEIVDVGNTDDDNNNDNPTTDSHPTGKTRIRVIWEWSHRCLGLTLLGISWFQCVLGIRLYRDG
jgi:hypothetical protein